MNATNKTSRITATDYGHVATATLRMLHCCRARPRTKQEAIDAVIQATGYSLDEVTLAFSRLAESRQLIAEPNGDDVLYRAGVWQ